MVIALVVTPEGFPLAYEALNGNTSDKTTPRGFLAKIEETYGKARRVWVMDRGIPTEAVLTETRQGERVVNYLVGTPRAKLKRMEKQWLELPWRKVRDSVQVKLMAQHGEMYVLAKSEGRHAKERAMRRKKLARLLGSEYAAGQRLLKRAMHNLGGPFADYVVVDGGFATAPFLHAVGDLGLPVIARLKDNLPELSQAAGKRFRNQPPKLTFRHGKDRIEVWDADDFDPWDTLRWETVRVLYYRRHKPNGDVFEAYWLTDLPMKKVSARSLFRLAKSRWEIENQGFNDAKSQHGLEHICHHHPNSLLMEWLLAMLALTMERLYRIRYLHRGTHAILAAIDLCRILWLSLSNPPPLVNTS